MATPAEFNLDNATKNPVVQGSSFSASITSWTIEYVSPFDLSGRTIRSQIRERYDSKDAALTFVCQITNATAGVFSISASTGQTVALNSNKRYVYDVSSTINNTVDYLMRGQVQIIPRVTQ